MIKALLVIMSFLPATLCIAAAFYLAANGKDGWGWFLFAAVFVAGYVKFGDSK